MVMDLYGIDLLQQLHSAYFTRYQLALERGYQHEDNRFFWLYEELHYRLQVLREAILFLNALPPFLQTPDAEKPYQYVVDFFTRYFSPDSIGRSERQGDDDTYFSDSNQYWNDFMEAMDLFGDEQLLKNLPLFYVYSCEVVVRAIRLYFQVREGKCHAIDRQKFDALMHGGNSLPTSA